MWGPWRKVRQAARDDLATSRRALAAAHAGREEVAAVVEDLQRIQRQNHLAPRIAAAFALHHQAGGPG